MTLLRGKRDNAHEGNRETGKKSRPAVKCHESFRLRCSLEWPESEICPRVRAGRARA